MNKKKIFLISTASKWFDIIWNIIFNLTSIPIFLKSWGSDMLGIWLFLHSIFSYIYLPNLSYQTFIYNKNLQLKKNRREISQNIYNSAIFSFLVSFIILLIYFFLKNEYEINYMINFNDTLKNEFYEIIFLYIIFIIFTYSVAPFFSDSLIIFGYQHLYSWFYSIKTFASSCAILISVYFINCNLKETIINFIIIEVIFYIFFFIKTFKFLSKENIIFKSFEFNISINNFIKSLWILITNILYSFTNHGLRILIIYISNPLSLTIFSAIKTISNLISKSINSLSDPMLPNIMELFNRKKEIKINNYLTIFYLFIIIIFFPLITIFNFFIEIFFHYWTIGQINFNRSLYFFLVAAVLLNSIFMPINLIVSGYNLNKEKLISNLIATIFLFTFTFALYEIYKITAFGIGLFIYEIINSVIIFFIFLKTIKQKKINISLNLFFYSLAFLSINLTCLVLIFAKFYGSITVVILINFLILLKIINKLNSNIKIQIKELIKIK